MAAERYVLKHFHYGQFVKNGKPQGDMRLLAKSSGISDAAVAEALKLAMIPPMKNEHGAWAIVRGKRETPFLLVESELGQAGQPALHFVLLPSEMVRAMGGNFRLLSPVLESNIPDYDRVGHTLKPIVIGEVRPPTDEQEIDDILDFMMYTRNRMNNMESLLGAVVQGNNIVIKNAPDDAEQRMAFISGLLGLLPPSVRFAVTVASHTLTSTKIEAQIRFIGSDDDPPDVVTYDWQKGELTGPVIKDDYSRFIVSQLRLDAELVVQQTRRLTSIASWRVKQGDKLADALAYASNRLSMDDAVLAGQPVEADDVAKMLAEDPTLTDELRLSYARHLMSFSLALNELEHAEPLGIMLNQNAELSDEAYRRLRSAVIEGAAGDVFDLMTRWLSNPLGPRGQRWVSLTHDAATTYYSDMIDETDIDEMLLFLADVDRENVSIAGDQLMPELIRMGLPVAVLESRLAYQSFLYACRHARIEVIERLLTNAELVKRLPDTIRAYAVGVHKQEPIKKPGLIIDAVKSIKESRRLVLVRLVELALKKNHPEAIDENVLKQLTDAARADWGSRYTTVLYNAVESNSDESSLRDMSNTGRRLLLEVLLAMGLYKELARHMLNHSRILYGVERQTDYAIMIQRVFAAQKIPEGTIGPAFEVITENGIRSLPLVMALIGVLDSYEKPTEETDAVAGDVTEFIADEAVLLDVIPIEAMRTLLMYHMRRRDHPAVIRTARMFAFVAARYGQKTTKLVVQVYKRMEKQKATAPHALDMVQRYIRFMARDEAAKTIEALSAPLEASATTQLRATYAVKLLMDEQPIEDFAQNLHRLAELLHDTYAAYINNRNTPTEGALHNDLDSMPGGLNSSDKKNIADGLLAMGRNLCEVHDRHKRIRNHKADNRIVDLLGAEEDPQSAVEILRVMGGYLSDGKRFQNEIEEQQHPHPLPGRNATSFKRDIEIARYSLQNMVDTPTPAHAKAVHKEMESIWNDVPKADRREIGSMLARDLQRVADLIPLIGAQGDSRIFEDTGLGRRLEANRARPRNTLEFYRYVTGYYLDRM